MVTFFKAILVGAVLSAATMGAASAPTQDGAISPTLKAFDEGRMPDRFKGLGNPLGGDAATLDAGRAVYAKHCASCHGEAADGGGPMAAALEVKPANLVRAVGARPDIDAYYFWIVSAGGAPFGRPMPRYARVLNETEIWQVVAWMQAGFPGLPVDAAPR